MNSYLAQVNIGQTFLGGVSAPQNASNVAPIVSRIVAGAISVAGIFLLYMLVMGGIGIISGAGSGDAQKLVQGKKAATTALIGFIVIIAAYWIVGLIEVLIPGIQLI